MYRPYIPQWLHELHDEDIDQQEEFTETVLDRIRDDVIFGQVGRDDI